MKRSTLKNPSPARAARPRSPRVRYAVIGLGHIAQHAVLPAFAHARNAELTALISDDPVKLRRLSRRYDVEEGWSYERLDEAFASGAFDAVYVAVPNHLHREFSERAANAGLHVLVEKPMALAVEDCEAMIAAAAENRVKLMVAYRLHFDPANLRAIEIARSGKLGDLRAFNSVFGMTVKDGDIRLRRETGGGTLWDIGIYCINAARYLMGEEPLEVFAYTSTEPKRSEVEVLAGVTMRFSGGRVAAFTTCFDSAAASDYEVLGTQGRLRVQNAYEYEEEIRHVLTVGNRTTERAFPPHDQFAAELVYFSDCIREDREPEPSGLEGLIDVAIIKTLYRSAEALKPFEYQGPVRRRRPAPQQEIERPAHAEEPELVHTSSPSED